ncbi:hypothetical protein NL676_023232, partial [Syzygium grande]
ILLEDLAMVWLNAEAVRKAIHAAPVSTEGPWSLCGEGRIIYNRDAGSMIPYHKNLTSKGYGTLTYSGDHDFGVPFTGIQAWTRSLGYNILDEWRSWVSNDQVAGDQGIWSPITSQGRHWTSIAVG